MQHPTFPQPADSNAVIWRYMVYDKFADIVTNRRLYMARADLLGDEHEGSTPPAELSVWSEQVKKAKNEDERQIILGNRQQLSRIAREFLATYYVSC
jgi:hypothetical protein